MAILADQDNNKKKGPAPKTAVKGTGSNVNQKTGDAAANPPASKTKAKAKK